MNVENGTEVAQFPEREYINGIFFAVHAAANTALHKTPVSMGFTWNNNLKHLDL